jgi:cation-transporting ATPase E
VAALVGMIPEGLYLLTSVALAASSLKLTRNRVLIQDMNCIETLARVDVLCVDKTGTITEPVMEVENILPLTEDPPEYLEAVLSALYSSRETENDTGKALSEIFNNDPGWHCSTYIPFSSETKWSGGVFPGHGSFLAGAPEFIMADRYQEIRETAESWSGAGYRVLLTAKYDGVPVPGALHSEKLTPLALVLLTNRIRPEAPKTFAYFAQQGVCVKVISGDNPVTAADVARRAGIQNAHLYIDAATLETQEDFLRAAEQYTVFGRVTPDKRRALIRAL